MITVPFKWTGYKKPMEANDDTFRLTRMWYTDNSTIGELHVDGTLLCYTLELSCRKANKIGKLAIPAGTYEIQMTPSPKFECDMPELLAVPGRTGIRIHPANKPEELEGCIATGLKHDTDAVWDSRKAFNLVLDVLAKKLAMGKVYISVLGGIHVEGISH